MDDFANVLSVRRLERQRPTPTQRPLLAMVYSDIAQLKYFNYSGKNIIFAPVEYLKYKT
jgi:hypothetical protein